MSAPSNTYRCHTCEYRTTSRAALMTHDVVSHGTNVPLWSAQTGWADEHDDG